MSLATLPETIWGEAQGLVKFTIQRDISRRRRISFGFIEFNFHQDKQRGSTDSGANCASRRYPKRSVSIQCFISILQPTGYPIRRGSLDRGVSPGFPGEQLHGSISASGAFGIRDRWMYAFGKDRRLPPRTMEFPHYLRRMHLMRTRVSVKRKEICESEGFMNGLFSGSFTERTSKHTGSPETVTQFSDTTVPLRITSIFSAYLSTLGL